MTVEQSDCLARNLSELVIKLERPSVSAEIRMTYAPILKAQILLAKWTPSVRVVALCEGRVYDGAKKVGAHG